MPTTTVQGQLKGAFWIEEDHTMFTILEDGKVLAEPEDAAFYIVEPSKYPQRIKDEFERRLGHSQMPKIGKRWYDRAEERAIRIRLRDNETAWELFERTCQSALHSAIEFGQRSIRVRLIIAEFGYGPPSQKALKDFKKLLEDMGLTLEVGSLITEPSRSDQPARRITYVPWTISVRP